MRAISSTQIKNLSGLIQAGKGIIYNISSGTISSKLTTENFNTYIDGSLGYTVTSNLDVALNLAAGATTTKYVLRSLHVTNISDQNAYLTGQIRFNSGNSAYLSNLFQLPVGGSAEFIQRPQLLQYGDKLYLQGFNKNRVAGNSLISATITYESISDDQSFIGTGSTLANSNTNIQILDTGTSSVVIESIKAVNLLGETATIKVYPTYSNAIPKSYYTYNLPIPPNSSVELLQGTKLLPLGDKLFAQYTSPYNTTNGVSIFVSYRNTESFNLVAAPTLAEFNNTVYVQFNTSVADGTVLYYTLEE
jgi:hypothetical protein